MRTTIGGRLAALAAAGTLVAFAGCGGDDGGVPNVPDVQGEIEEAQDSVNDAQEAIEDPEGEVRERIDEELRRQLEGEGGEGGG